jgi:hypothetical protein
MDGSVTPDKYPDRTGDCRGRRVTTFRLLFEVGCVRRRRIWRRCEVPPHSGALAQRGLSVIAGAYRQVPLAFVEDGLPGGRR